MVETICDIIDEVPDAQRSDATRERIVMVPDEQTLAALTEVHGMTWNGAWGSPASFELAVK